jgi:ribonuclease G
MFISSSPHETKLAVVEDDQLVEVYIERDTDVGLVGGIYKGRVSRVLPGMQSAFVDIGLDRDAFLYVSDFFFEDQEDYDKILEEAEACAVAFGAEAAQAGAAPPSGEVLSPPVGPDPVLSPTASVEAPVAPAQAPAESQAVKVTAPDSAGNPQREAAPAPPLSAPPSGDSRPPSQFDPRGRRWRHRGRKFGEHRPAEHKFVPRHDSFTPAPFEILPGESLAKYGHAAPQPVGPVSEETIPDEPEALDLESLEQAEYQDAADASPEAASGVGASRDATEEVGGPGFSRADAGSEGVAALAEAQEGVAPSSTPVAAVAEEEAAAEPSPATSAAPEEGFATDAAPEALPAESTLPVLEPSPAPPETASPAAEPVGTADEPTLGEEIPPDLRPAHVLDALDETAESVTDAEEEQEEEGLASAPADSSAEVAPEPGTPAADQELSQASPESPTQTGGAEPGPAPSEGTYTLREPHQRPRFAPRRGRRGRRGVNNQGRSEPRWESRPGNNQPVQISKLLKEGQEILVQISKEPLGSKGARITSHIALPGRYLVYMPTIDHIGVSRKISSEEERLRLRNIILEQKGSLPGGFIVRTAGQGRDQEELKADLKFLSTLWGDIRARAEGAKAPALIHRDLDLVQRVLRDTLTPDFKSVRVDSEADYVRVLDFVNRSQPTLVGKVKLYSRETPLFEEFGIQAEIEKALKPKVWLKSGGYIVINQTEALVAIDVNTGKYVGKTNRLEDTILKTNFDAVNEIVRQVRLRDLGGIIVVDFIDMDERKNRAKVTQALEEALHKDRAPTKVIAFHDFGLVAVTRKRVKQSLERTLCERCSYCSGSGWVKSATTVAYEVLAEARRMAAHLEGKTMTLRVNPEVAKLLKSRDSSLLSELESFTHKDVFVKSDPSVEQERFEVF